MIDYDKDRFWQIVALIVIGWLFLAAFSAWGAEPTDEERAYGIEQLKQAYLAHNGIPAWGMFSPRPVHTVKVIPPDPLGRKGRAK